MKKFLTIIMPIYQPDWLVKKALDSLAIQTNKNFEVIVINDCSPNTKDEYQSLLHEYKDQLDITYLKTFKNSGPSLARKLGLDIIKTKWVIFLDDDDELANELVVDVLSKYQDQNYVGVKGKIQTWHESTGEIAFSTRFGLKHLMINVEFLKTFNINFHPELTFEEDTLFYSLIQYYRPKWKNPIIISIPFVLQIKNTYQREDVTSLCDRNTSLAVLKYLKARFSILPIDDLESLYILKKIQDYYELLIHILSQYKQSHEIKIAIQNLQTLYNLSQQYDYTINESQFAYLRNEGYKFINHQFYKLVRDLINNCDNYITQQVPHLVIIMPCYQRDSVVEQALKSFARQSSKDFEVWMINDCSPHTKDDYQTLINQYKTDIDIKYFKMEHNSGPGECRQFALDRCNYKWIFFIDDDDVLTNDTVVERIQQVIKKFSKDNRLWSIAGDRQFFKDNEYLGRFIGADNLTTLTGRALDLEKIKLCNIRFNPIISYNYEDMLFIQQFLYYQQIAYGYSLDLPNVYTMLHFTTQPSITQDVDYLEDGIHRLMFDGFYYQFCKRISWDDQYYVLKQLEQHLPKLYTKYEKYQDKLPFNLQKWGKIFFDFFFHEIEIYKIELDALTSFPMCKEYDKFLRVGE